MGFGDMGFALCTDRWEQCWWGGGAEGWGRGAMRGGGYEVTMVYGTECSSFIAQLQNTSPALTTSSAILSVRCCGRSDSWMM